DQARQMWDVAADIREAHAEGQVAHEPDHHREVVRGRIDDPDLRYGAATAYVGERRVERGHAAHRLDAYIRAASLRVIEDRLTRGTRVDRRRPELARQLEA